jgi:O-antigen/teichoic acid export membrane protein
LANALRPSDPLVRNGYVLVLSTAISGLLGVAYWIAAAHLFPARDLGLDSAALTAMMLVASVAGMNLSGALVFLLPKLGRSLRGYVWRSYRSAGLAALALGVVAALASTRLSGSKDFLTGSLALAALFVAACGAWVIFTIQDGVLVGLQRPTWVLAENSAFGVAKLGLLAVTSWWGLRHGVLLSWVLPVFLLVPAVNLLVFRRAVPAVEHRPERLGETPLRRFLGLNYASSLIYQAYVNLLPLLVLVALGAEANGLFYVAWTWSTAIDLVSHAMGVSLTVESSAEPDRLGEHIRRTSARLAALVVPGVLAVLVVAPQLMGLYGGRYRASAHVLRLLALGALPRGVVIVAQSASRARGEGGLMLWSEGVICALALGLTALLINDRGASAVGIAWLVANTVAAVLVLPTLRTAVRAG